MLQEPLISIIVPAYNAEKYIDRCVESICNQTYENWEAIILNDGSTDSTAQLVKAWSVRDDRITYVEHENIGMGKTRNKGLSLSKGLYVTFVDSDDWIEKQYLELLYKALSSKKSRISRCNFKLHDMQANTISEAGIKDKINLEDVEFYKYPNLWSNLFDITLFMKHNIEMPSIPFEDMAIYPLLALLSGNVACVEKPLYNYQINAGTSVMDNPLNMKYFPEAADYLIKHAKRLNLYTKYQRIIMEVVLYHMNGTLQSRIKNNYSADKFEEFKKYFIEFWDKNFYNWREVLDISQYWLWGSYNLSRIIANMSRVEGYNLMQKDLGYYFGFSSIIPLFNGTVNGKVNEILHDNLMRNNMLEKEINRAFKNVDMKAEEYLLIDFLEERYDIVEIDGEFLTYSSAFKESTLALKDYNIISRLSEQCNEMWETACLKFIELIRSNCNLERVVLLEAYLSPICKMRNGNTAHWDNISDINRMLKHYYSFFIKSLPEIFVIEVPNEFFYTDAGSKYGDEANYYNVNLHKQLAKIIKKHIIYKNGYNVNFK